MSELPEIKQSEKYPDEITSFILGNCFDIKDTAEIVKRCNCHNELVGALEKAKIALNLCARVFLGTGELPEPEIMADAIIEIVDALAKVNKKT